MIGFFCSNLFNRLVLNNTQIYNFYVYNTNDVKNKIIDFSTHKKENFFNRFSKCLVKNL